MLEDRDYMRQPEYHEPGWLPVRARGWSLTIWFLIVYAVVYVAEVLVSPAPLRLIPGNAFCNQYFALSVEGLRHGYVWQLVTYQFMHAGFMHLFFNAWAIYMFGSELEQMVGRTKFFALMITSGIVGGIFQAGAAFIWPQYFGGAVVGASASGFGLVAAFALLLPTQEITMLIFYILPVTIRAKTLLYISGGMALAGFAFPRWGGNVAHTAHLGGMLTGIFFARQIFQGNWFQRDTTVREKPRAVAARPVRAAQAAVPVATYSMTEVDSILDKISARGINSLTTHERDVLEKARNKMRGA